MNKVSYMTTPNGEELVVLPRKDWDDMKETLDHAKAIGEFHAGKAPGLTIEETKALIEAVSPLSFWRKYRELTQAALAGAVGVTQNYLSDIENGKRGGDVTLWLRLARALDLPVEVLVDEDEQHS